MNAMALLHVGHNLGLLTNEFFNGLLRDLGVLVWWGGTEASAM